MDTYRKVSILFLALVFTGLNINQFSRLAGIATPLILFAGAASIYFHRIKINRFLENLSQYVSETNEVLERFIDSKDSRMLDLLISKKTLLGILTVSFFMFHFWFQWSFNRHVILSGVIHIVVDPFYFLIQHGVPEAFTYRHFQINSYTGNPFFLLPFMFLAGYSPLGLRLVLIGVFASSIAFYFLAYKEALDLKKAFLATLMLTSMSTWVLYRWADYDYTILFFSILLYLYFRWLRLGGSPESRYLYLMSFLGGLLFYFKGTTAYMGLSMLAALVYVKRDNLWNFVQELDVSVLIVLFLLGATPFFVYGSFHTDTLIKDGFSFGGPENSNLTEVPIQRFNQLDYWLKSDVTRVSDSSFYTDLNPLEEYNLFSVLLLAGIVSLILLRKHVQIPIMFAVFYILMFFLPIRSGVWKYQLTVLVPLVPLILVSVLDSIPEKLEKTPVYRLAYLGLCALFIIGISMNISELQLQDRPDADSFDVNYWAGDQKYYRDFESLNISHPVVTNSYRVQVITKYFPEIRSADYLLPSNTSRNSLKNIDGNRRLVALTTYYSAPLDKWTEGEGSIAPEDNFTIVLRENLPCEPGKEVCGATVNETLGKLSVQRPEMQRVMIEEDSYLISRR